ncbi:MAG TPA: AMP-binding protein [Pasteurellaceae bacterium]|nr:AMP-binding protein [Pasteurellaceae bacterium]
MDNINQRQKDFLVAQNPSWPWQDFVYRVNQIADQLQQDKISSLALWLEDAAHFACILLACFQARVRVLLPPNQLAENRQWIEENADFCFTEQDFATFGHSQKPQIIRPHFDWNNNTEIWLKTSGSSGQAKIIVKTARQMWQEVKAIAHSFSFSEVDQIIGSVSTQHLYGLTFRIMLPLYQGYLIGRMQLNYPEYLTAESRTLQTLWISSPALLSCVNTADNHLAQCRLSAVISSGGALSENVAEDLRIHLNCPLIEIYGSSETGVIASRSDNCLWQHFVDSQIGVNEQGHLWIESAWSNGKQQTADCVNIYPQGFELLGRADRIIKLNDRRISLARIEQNLLKHQWVIDCYVMQHPQRQRLIAWVALSDSALEKERTALITEFKRHLSYFDEKFALPRFWRFCAKLPRNEQFKLNYADIERMCAEITS